MGETRNIYNVAVRKSLAYGMVGRRTLNLPSRKGTQAFRLVHLALCTNLL